MSAADMPTFTAADLVAATGDARFNERFRSAFAPERLAEYVTMLDDDGLPIETSSADGRLRFVAPLVPGESGSLNVLVHYDRIVGMGISLVLQALNVSERDMETIAAQFDDRQRARVDVAEQFAEFNLAALLEDVEIDLKTE
jgi:hypothetical protein